MATHSNILAWITPWTEEPGRLQSIESQRVRLDWSGLIHTSLSSTPLALATWASPSLGSCHASLQSRNYGEMAHMQGAFQIQLLLRPKIVRYFKILPLIKSQVFCLGEGTWDLGSNTPMVRSQIWKNFSVIYIYIYIHIHTHTLYREQFRC